LIIDNKKEVEAEKNYAIKLMKKILQPCSDRIYPDKTNPEDYKCELVDKRESYCFLKINL
jgi:hypothetical protein